MVKVCKFCWLEKPIDSFRKGSKHALRNTCIDCENESKRTKRFLSGKDTVIADKRKFGAIVCNRCFETKGHCEFREYNDYGTLRTQTFCKSCDSKRNVQYWREHKEEINDKRRDHRNEYQSEWREQNPDKVKEYQDRSYKNNRDYILSDDKPGGPCKKCGAVESRSWALGMCQPCYGAYRKSTPRGRALHCAKEAKRRSIKLQAFPPWLSEEQLEEIKKIYENCPESFHVDHIVPLQGRDVCGLHVPWNLQYLSAAENLRKSNKLLISGDSI